MNEWLNHPALKNMDPVKLELIKLAAKQTEGKNGKSLAPVMMSLISSAHKKGITFSPEEMSFVLEILKDGKSKEEQAQIDRMVGENNRIKAYASVILGGEYVVRDIAVMDSKNGLFARMPYRSYKDRNGDMKYSDTVFAMNETSRNAINDAVLAAYEQRLHMEQDEAPDMEESIDESPGMVQSM